MCSRASEGTGGVTLAIFDFDKTIVSRDSFRLFGYEAASSRVQRAAVFLLAACCKLRLLSNARYKAAVLRLVWAGKTDWEQERVLERLTDRLRILQNAPVLSRLREHLKRRDLVAVVSASPECYLRPFVRSLSDEIRVLGSRTSVADGRLSIDNLFRDKKADVARELIREVGADEVYVYSDHFDDLELLRLGHHVTVVGPSKRTLRALRRLGIEFETIEV